MEEQLDKIVRSSKSTGSLKVFYSTFDKQVNPEQELEKVKIEDEVSEEKCELCGRNMVIKRGRYGKFLACPGFPECKNTKPIVTEIGVSCPDCGNPLVVRRTKRGRIFYGCSDYPDCKFVSWNKPVEIMSTMELYGFKNSKGKEYEVCSNKECGYKAK